MTRVVRLIPGEPTLVRAEHVKRASAALTPKVERRRGYCNELDAGHAGDHAAPCTLRTCGGFGLMHSWSQR